MAVTRISPNHITTLSLVVALTAAQLLGAAGAISAVIALFLNLSLDREKGLEGGDAVGYPGFAGFELEDEIYLIGPVKWLGWLTPFFFACGIGAVIYCLWTAANLRKIQRVRRSKSRSCAAGS